MPSSRSLTFAIVVGLAIASPVAAQGGRGGGGGGGGVQTAQPVPAPRFEYVGPQSAGRISAATAVSGKPGVYFAGAASGGVWKSSDGGSTWKPTFDSQSSQAIGALATSLANPNIVWAGTGEAWAVRDMDMMGDGIYKSTDQGETWTNVGLKETGRIGTIVTHPTNENIVLVCALGRATGPQQERGVFRSEDGGATWKHTLFVNPNTGCSGLQMSMKDPNIVIAGTWEVELQTHVLHGGGMGSGIYLSKDGGKTFTKVTHPGLPKSPIGKTDVAIAPSDGNRMYALIQTGSDGVKGIPSQAQGSLWRSDDAGKTWRNVSWDRRLIGRAGYYIRIRVSPDNPDHLLIANSTLWQSRDGGKIWTSGGGGCGDCHDIWWDVRPDFAGHYIVTGDGGMGIYGSPNNPTGNTSVSLPIGQMYRVTIDQRSPYWLYSDRQDDGSMRLASNRPIVPGNVPSYAPPPPPAGAVVAGGAPGGRGNRAGGAAVGGRAAAGGAAGGAGRAAGAGGGAGRAAAAAADTASGGGDLPGEIPAGRGAGRAGGGGGGAAPAGPQQESMPSCESGYTYPEPNNSRFVWGTCYAAHVATFDELSGQRRSVSPWMHTLDSSPVGLKYRCQWSPPLAIDWFDNSVYFGCQVLFRTRTRGQSWDVISPDLSTGDPSRILGSGGVVQDNLGQFYGALISAIAPSRTQQGVVWVGTNDGKVWVSKNSGGAWTDLTKNFTMPPWGLVRRIDASHFDPATAYIAVDFHLVDNRDPFLFKTNDFGATWTRIDGGLPRGHPLDYTLAIAENPHRRGMIFAGTGHGFFYSLNDGQTWTQYKDKLPAAPVNWIEIPKNAAEIAVATYGRGLWILRDVWQLENSDIMQQGDFQLLNPLPGMRTANGTTASFVFSLRAASTDTITVEVLGPDGFVISNSRVTGKAGLNQVSATLTYPGPGRIVMRSIPPDNPFIWDAGRWPGHERPVTHWGLGAATFQPRVAPGKYTVRMTYAGRPYTKTFDIVRDVNLPSTDAELIAGTDIQRKIVTAINEVVDKTNRIENLRAQVEDLRKVHAKNKTYDKALADIYKKMYDTELHFLSRTEMHSDDKWYVEAWGLYQNLVWLLAEVGSGGGDVMGGTSYGPTNATLSVFQDRVRDMEASRVAFDKLVADVAAFNTTYAGKIAKLSDTPPLRGGD